MIKETLINMLRGLSPSEEIARKNVVSATRLIDKLDRRIADKRAEDRLRQMGRLMRVNGHKI